MKAGIVLSAGGPREAAELAEAAEAAGWDGVFTWDGIAIGEIETFDPWVTLAAMAMRTEHIRIGAIVTPPARRRPWKLARETMSIDRLSGGRLILPVGLGALDDGAFGKVGEPTEARVRAERLDESLAILEGLWSGEAFGFQGEHYRFEPMTFRPRPIQRPRIPIWVVGAWPNARSTRRALRFDGILPQTNDPSAIADLAAFIARERPLTPDSGPFEVVVEGTTPDPSRAHEILEPLQAGGATWWIESDWTGASVESLRARILAGPPRI